MKGRTIHLINDLRESYWFVPTVMSVAAVLLAFGIIWFDSHHATGWLDRL